MVKPRYSSAGDSINDPRQHCEPSGGHDNRAKDSFRFAGLRPKPPHNKEAAKIPKRQKPLNEIKKTVTQVASIKKQRKRQPEEAHQEPILQSDRKWPVIIIRFSRNYFPKCANQPDEKHQG
jgi:hypothetical protein